MSEQDIGAAQPRGDGAAAEMTEEEMQARMEEQLRQIRVQDVVAESAVSIINLTARRIGKEDERDLEQARVGIEAVRALTELVEGELQGQLRAALSEIQMMYAKESGSPAPAPTTQPGAPAFQPGATNPAATPPQQPGPGDAGAQPGQEPPSRLWTPGR